MERQHLTRTSQGDHRRRPLITSARPMRSPEHPLQHLQGLIGNRAMGRFIQAKLRVSQAEDVYEQEADRVAEQVMRMPGAGSTISSNGAPAAVQTKCDACAGGGGACPACDSEEPTVQRRSLASTLTPVIQRQLNVCEAIEEEEAEQTIQRSSDGSIYASSNVSQMIERTKGEGGALPENVQREFETKMGADFSEVRVHTDNRAAELSRELGAHAFTHGADIYFSAGKYNPESAEGKYLLAHELTHTIQQQGNNGSVQRLTVTPTGTFFKGDCGNYRKRWIFELSAAAPEDGYIVQKVDLYEEITDCPRFAACLVDPTLTFWEAWYVKKGDTLQHIHSSVGWTDQATRGPADKKSGYHVAEGEIKFYKKSVTGDLGKEDVLSSDPKSDWKPGTKGGVALAGWLPSTTSKPSWWSDAPTEGPKTRQAYSAWACCGSKSDFNIIRAEP